MRAECFVLLALTSCVLVEANSAAPERDCGEKGTARDYGNCHCNSDCQSERLGAACLAEFEYAWPGGICARPCKLSAECDTGFLCESELCLAVCTTSADCGPGRICPGRRDGSPSTCLAFCDEDADCEYAACNVYNGECLLYDQQIRGAGLNAPCKTDGDCRSDWCGNGVCKTFCDVSSPHCPEGGVCVSGICQNACTAGVGCALNQSCVQTDAGDVCSQ